MATSNLPDKRAAGAKHLDDARRRLLAEATYTADRLGALAEFARGKITLNVGCVGRRPGKPVSRDALARHVSIARASAECLGIDPDAEGIEELRRMGFAAEVADACYCELGRQFETIVAGEVIEHVANAGQFLENLRRHLKVGGTLAVSTCNPFCTKRFWKILRHGHPCVHPEHTCWFDPVTLMGLAMRCGLTPHRLIWVRPPAGLDWRLWPRALRNYFCEQFILALRRDA